MQCTSATTILVTQRDDMATLIQPLIDGLEILKAHDAGAPVVAKSYLIYVPDVKTGDLTSDDIENLIDLGWKEYPEEDTYFYLTTS